jgi:hypothetical protein
MSLLTRDESDVIKQFDFEGRSWEEILDDADVAFCTLRRRRKRGIDKLVEFYSVLDKVEAIEPDSECRLRFIGYIHKERYLDCLSRLVSNDFSGIEAMFYIISGCNELWNAGVDTFYNFDAGEIILQEHMTQSFSDKGEKLLRLAYCLSHGLIWDRLGDVLKTHFRELEHVHLELALEALLISLFPRYRYVSKN